MWLCVWEEVNLVLDSRRLAQMTVSHFVVGLEYGQHFVASVLELAAFLDRLVPVFCVMCGLLFRLCCMALYAG